MASPAPTSTSTSERGMQYALGAVVVALLAIAAWRWVGTERQPRPVDVHRENSRIDLNRAGRSELLQLPGIGPSRADGILAYRQRHGGFRNTDELQSVEGIGPVAWRRLEPFVFAGSIPEPGDDEPVRLQRKPRPPGSETATIDLNRATAEELEGLPGIGKTLAQRIIEQRERQPFRSIDELRRVSGIGNKRFDQIRPLVRVSAE